MSMRKELATFLLLLVLCAIVTALNPYIGYEKTSALAREAHATGRGVYELVLEKQWLSQADLDRILSPDNLTRPRMPVRG